MVDDSVIRVVQHYLAVLNGAGVHAIRGVVFGSYARGEQRWESDIDLVVVAPEFDNLRDRRLSDLLWRMRAHADPRIEPIPCGERQWEEDNVSPVIEMARREGQVIPYVPQAV